MRWHNARSRFQWMAAMVKLWRGVWHLARRVAGCRSGGAAGLGIRRAVAKAGYRESAGDLVRLSTQFGPTMHERANRAVGGSRGCVDLPLLWLRKWE
jgi:hypothetical protein